MARTWRLGTRGSDLARTQSKHVAAQLRRTTGDDVELVVIRTKGDAVRDRPLAQVGGKGLFTKEIEDAMLAGEVDFAVHSMKDMPTVSPPGLAIVGVPTREDPRDVVVGTPLADLAPGGVVGTGSARRAMQVQVIRPDVEVRGIRGNVETRIGKMRGGDYDAVVLAAAGMARLGLTGDVDEFLDVDRCVPAVGQGALAVQCREDDTALVEALRGLSDPDTLDEIALERAFLVALGGGCSVPVACHAICDGERLRVRAFVGREDGAWVAESGVCDRADGPRVGAELARRLTARLAHQPPRGDEGTARSGR